MESNHFPRAQNPAALGALHVVGRPPAIGPSRRPRRPPQNRTAAEEWYVTGIRALRCRKLCRESAAANEVVEVITARRHQKKKKKAKMP